MIQTIQITLNEFAGVLNQLENAIYTRPCSLLSDATIGQHTRHIIELYQCLLEGYQQGDVYYDKRKRDKHIENDAAVAINYLETIQHAINQPDKDLHVTYELNGNNCRLRSNYFREAMYNLEHTIHHLALIKVAIHLFTDVIVSDSFGVAPSTVKFRSQCVQ